MLSRAALTALSMVLFVAGIACRQDRGHSERVENGTLIVENVAPANPEHSRRVRLVADMVFPEDPANSPVWFSPLDIEADTAGRIYILDSRDKRLRVFSPKGELIREVGGAGQGPGEFEYPLQMALHPDGSIYVLDMYHIHAFEPDTFDDRIIPAPNVNRFSICPNGDLLVNMKVAVEGGEPRSFVDRLAVLHPETEEARILYEHPQLMTARVSDGTFTFSYPLFVRWSVDGKGRIVFGWAEDYEFEFRDRSGQVSRKFSRAVEREFVSGELRGKIEGVFQRLSSPNRREIEKILFYPAFLGIDTDERGRFWVQRYVHREDPAGRPRFDVFSSDGVLLFEVTVADELIPSPVFRNGFIYALRRGELGEVQAVRYRLVE